MVEVAKKFLNKECIVYAQNHQLSGTITEVTQGAIMLTVGATTEAINLDYVIRIREYPRKKNGKKKEIILD